MIGLLQPCFWNMVPEQRFNLTDAPELMELGSDEAHDGLRGSKVMESKSSSIPASDFMGSRMNGEATAG